MKSLAILLLIIRCSAPVCWAQTGTEMLEKYQVRLHKIQIVSYDVQRTTVSGQAHSAGTGSTRLRVIQLHPKAYSAKQLSGPSGFA